MSMKRRPKREPTLRDVVRAADRHGVKVRVGYERRESEIVSDVLGRLSSAWDSLVLNRDNAPLSKDAQECAKHLRNVFGVSE